MIQEVIPPVPVITPMGTGHARLVNYAHHSKKPYWVVKLDKSGEVHGFSDRVVFQRTHFFIDIFTLALAKILKGMKHLTLGVVCRKIHTIYKPLPRRPLVSQITMSITGKIPKHLRRNYEIYKKTSGLKA